MREEQLHRWGAANFLFFPVARGCYFLFFRMREGAFTVWGDANFLFFRMGKGQLHQEGVATFLVLGGEEC